MQTFSGSYLKTSKLQRFSDTPEIFLLHEEGDVVRGYCVNKLAGDADGNLIQPRQIQGELERRIVTFLSEGETQKLPLYYSGSHRNLDLNVIHMDPGGSNKTRAILKHYYYVSPTDVFIDEVKSKRLNAGLYIAGCYGHELFERQEIETNVRLGSWEVKLSDLHLTYGPIVTNKAAVFDAARNEKPSNQRVGDTDIGSIAGFLFDTAVDKMVPMMAAVACFHFKENTDLTDQQIIRATELMLTVADAEGTDLMRVMRKYTHQEIAVKFETLIQDGFKSRLVATYHKWLKEFEAVGLNHHFAFLAMGMIHSRQNTRPDRRAERKPKAKPPSIQRLEDNMSAIGQIVRDEGQEKK
ncbi:MAG: hypothetical protein ACE37E_11180 [Hyphomicrobiales bacterium]